MSDAEEERFANSNSSFTVGAIAFNLFFYAAFLYFFTCNKEISFEEHVYLNLIILIFVSS